MEKFSSPPTYDLGKFKRDLGKRASSLSHMNTMQNFIGKGAIHKIRDAQGGGGGGGGGGC